MSPLSVKYINAHADTQIANNKNFYKRRIFSYQYKHCTFVLTMRPKRDNSPFILFGLFVS